MEDLLQQLQGLSASDMASLLSEAQDAGLNLTMVQPDDKGPSPYAQCVAAHTGQCGYCTQEGNFIPCS